MSGRPSRCWNDSNPDGNISGCGVQLVTPPHGFRPLPGALKYHHESSCRYPYGTPIRSASSFTASIVSSSFIPGSVS